MQVGSVAWPHPIPDAADCVAAMPQPWRPRTAGHLPVLNVPYREYVFGPQSFGWACLMTTDLAGQLKSSVGSELGFGTATGSANSNFGWSSFGQARSSAGGCKLARSLSINAGPPITQPYCMCAFMAHASSRSWHTQARSYQRKPASNLPPFLFILFFRNDLFGTRGASKRDA